MIPVAQGRHGEVFACPPVLSAATDDPQEAAEPDEHDSENVNGMMILSRWYAVKVVHAGANGTSRGSEPHNVSREAQLLQRVQHANIITLLGYTYEPSLHLHRLSMPLYPCTLSDLLTDWTFPFGIGSASGGLETAELSTIVPQVISRSLLSAIAFLHTLETPIAHRDVNPSNVLIDWDGTVKLGDFGTVWCGERRVQDSQDVGYDLRGQPNTGAGTGDTGRDTLWSEDSENMCCDVGSGSYRAPELLFSSRTYDAQALDLWAAGCTIAQLFRPYRRQGYISRSGSDNSAPSSSSGSEHSSELDPLDDRPHHTMPTGADPNDYDDTSDRSGSRVPLFDATYGTLGLAASIFRLLGTPTLDTWPSFHLLPDADKIAFIPSIPAPIDDRLPDLDRLGPQAGPAGDLVASLLRLDPEQRVSTSQCLVSDWLASETTGADLEGYRALMADYLGRASEPLKRKIQLYL